MPVQAIAHPRNQPRQQDPSNEPLRFGLTFADLVGAARRAVKYDFGTRGFDYEDRYETAWFGVVECLYAASEPVEAYDLYIAGLDALRKMRSDDRRTRGFKNQDSYNGPGSAPGFVTYWLPPSTQTQTEAGFAARLVDEMAVRQVFALLTRPQREALLALALHSDYNTAARSLGLSLEAFAGRLKNARVTFFAAWYAPDPVPDGWTRNQTVWRYDLRPAVAAVLAPEEISAVLVPDARTVFARLGADRLRSADLLAELAAARPEIYGRWDLIDLADAFRRCGIPPRDIFDGPRHYRGYDADSLAPAAVGGQADNGPELCDVILASWLSQEQAAAELPADHLRARMRRLIAAAGPAGITPAQLAGRLGTDTSALKNWLSDDAASGIIARGTGRRYVSPEHAQPAWPVPALPDDHPRAEMLRAIRDAGPDGVRSAALVGKLDGRAVRGTIALWLKQECNRGTITRLRQGVYAACAEAPARELVPA
jgi:DNA-directed RNA polymerase specialized sigma24 family protein